MKTKKILQKLCTDCGVSGREGEMLDIIRELSEKYAYDVRQLPTGTIVASVGDKNAKHHVMLDAHIDFADSCSSEFGSLPRMSIVMNPVSFVSP